MNFPIRTFKKLWHVGSFNPAHKRRDSQEGSGLSVSLHPWAWTIIAKLGKTCWQLEKPGNRFLNAVRLTAAQKRAIRDWAIAEHYLIPATLFRMSYSDQDENGEDIRRSQLFNTRKAAELESEEYEGVRITEIEGVVGTQKLWRATRIRLDPATDEDLAMTLYADMVLGLDGVWWQDPLDPYNYLAPKGVIFVRRVAEWARTKVPLPEEPDFY